jgi:tetratricopeptide (TPR) repeat protein
MGNLKMAMGDTAEAEKLYKQAHALDSKEGDDPQGSAWHEFHMGTVYLARGHHKEALERFTHALHLFERLQDNLGQVVTYTHLGEIACRLKDLPKAEEYLKKGVALILASQSSPLMVDILTGIAQYLKEKKEEKKAISLLMVALSHPTCRQQTKDRMVSLAMELETRFSTREVDEGFKWAKQANLEDVAAGWLASVSNGSKPGRKSKKN